jgi:rubrerythrin
MKIANNDKPNVANKPTMVGEWLFTRFSDALAASPRGLAYLYKFYAGCEEGDEQGVFDRLLERVEDPELHRLVRKHRDDEVRHAALFRGLQARVGIPDDELPDPVPFVPYIDREIGEISERFIDDRVTVLEAYTMLQVIEESGVCLYPMLARTLARFDPEAAPVVSKIAEDERRHVKYAQAIRRRYAPNPKAADDTLRRYRAAEKRASVKHARALADQVVAHGLISRRTDRLLFGSVIALRRWQRRLPASSPVHA